MEDAENAVRLLDGKDLRGVSVRLTIDDAVSYPLALWLSSMYAHSPSVQRDRRSPPRRRDRSRSPPRRRDDRERERHRSRSPYGARRGYERDDRDYRRDDRERRVYDDREREPRREEPERDRDAAWTNGDRR